MKSHTYHAFVALIFIMATIITGVLLCVLPYASNWIDQLINILQERPKVFLYTGIGVTTFGLSLFALFYFLNKKSYYFCEIEKSLKVEIEPKIIQKGISEVLTHLEPHHNIPFKLNIYGKNIELIADLSQFSIERHEEILDRLEPKLQSLFEETYGEPKTFKLAVAALKG